MEQAVQVFAIVNFVVIGLSHIVRPRAWVDFFAWLCRRGEAGVFTNAFLSLIFGSIIVAFHNVWTGIPVVLTIIGWAQVAKALIYFTFPAYGLRKMQIPSHEKPQLFLYPGVAFLVLAGLLGYHLATGGYPRSASWVRSPVERPPRGAEVTADSGMESEGAQPAAWEAWNAFVELLAMSEPEELSPEQRPAQGVFWYDSEVQNGGHLQYFLNRGPEEAQRAVADLRALGAEGFSELLAEAVEVWQRAERNAPETAEEYVEIALEGEFDELDSRFHELTPSLNEVLERHLAANRELYLAEE